MRVEVTIRRNAQPNGDSPADGIRVLALLPTHWRKALRQIAGELVITVESENNPPSRVKAEVSSILAHPVFNHLEIAQVQQVVAKED